MCAIILGQVLDDCGRRNANGYRSIILLPHLSASLFSELPLPDPARPYLEDQLQSELHPPGVERAGDYSHVAGPGGVDGRSSVRNSESKIGMVERVEHFPPELQVHPFLDREVTVYPDIGCEGAGALDYVCSGIAKGPQCRKRECRRIEPVVDAALIGRQVGIATQIRAFPGGATGVLGARSVRRPVDRVKMHPAIHGPQARNVPIPDDLG